MLFSYYVFRSLRARLKANLVTMLAVGLFVAGSTLGFSLYLNLKGQLVDATPPENILVLSKGAASETGSNLKLDSARKVELVEGLKKDGDVPLAVREIVTTFQFTDQASAQIRGFDARSLQVHQVKVVEGTLPAEGSLEVMIGRRLARQHSHLRVGADLFLPKGASRISGVFDSGGSAYEEEIWTHRAALELHLHAQFLNSSTLVAESAAKVPEIVAKLNATKDYEVQAASLSAFRADGAGLDSIRKLVLVLMVLLLVVATSAIATTMSATVISRLPEFAAMVAIGVRRSRLGRMVVMESALLAATGAVLGIAAGEVVRRTVGIVTLGTNPIELSASAIAPLFGLVLGVAVGLIGSIVPVLSVRRMDLIATLR